MEVSRDARGYGLLDGDACMARQWPEVGRLPNALRGRSVDGAGVVLG